MNGFLSVLDLDPESLGSLLDRAAWFKANRGVSTRCLEGRSVGLLFEKPSTRTRISFEVAVVELGGHPVVLSGAETQLGRGESIEDTARTVSRYLHALVVRTFAQDRLERLAAAGSIPVVNALSDHEHPCQAVADLLTIRERVGHLAGVHIAYLGDGNNVAHSLLLAAALAGMHITVVTPTGFAPDPGVVADAMALASKTGGRVEVSCEVSAIAGARFLYTDVWASMGKEDEAEARRSRFQPYQIDAALLRLAGEGAAVLHCLPAHRGEEITHEVFEANASIIFDQAENRLHAQKAILEALG